MSGLPGVGKDTWIRQNLPELPVVSLDTIRAQNGVSPKGNQGRVIQAAYEQARVYLRARQDFICNGTNVTRQHNKGRGRVVPAAVIAGLERKLEPPTLSEAHEVTVVAVTAG